MDAKTFLMGSGSAGFSFNMPGDRITGQILSDPTMAQQKVFGTNDLAFWPSGDPKMQMLVQVQTQFRNYEGISAPDRTQPDSGVRTIYVKGKHFEKATRDAVRDAGAGFLDVGGWIDVVYVGPDMESKAGMKPKLFNVRYQPPAPGSQPAQRQPAPPAQAQPQQGWQQAGWNPAQANWTQQGYPTQAYPAQQFHQQGMDRIAGSVPQSAVPSHHGQPDQMPTWAAAPNPTPHLPTSAPPGPAPTSAPPALSTLDMLKAGMSDQAGTFTDEPPF